MELTVQDRLMLDRLHIRIDRVLVHYYGENSKILGEPVIYKRPWSYLLLYSVRLNTGATLKLYVKIMMNPKMTSLKQAMQDRLPRDVLNKPKQGFSIPLKHWLRGPLKPLMMDLLSVERVNRRGYFNADCVSGWVTEHIESTMNHSHRLWALMVFELWNDQIMDIKTPSREVKVT